MSELSPYAGPHPTSVTTPPSPQPPPATGTPGWALFLAWAGLITGVVVTFVGTLVASALVYFGQSAGCGETADAATIHVGMRSLLIVLAVAAAPWALGWILTRHRIIATCAALVALLPISYALGLGLTTGAWDDGWCF